MEKFYNPDVPVSEVVDSTVDELNAFLPKGLQTHITYYTSKVSSNDLETFKDQFEGCYSSRNREFMVSIP